MTEQSKDQQNFIKMTTSPIPVLVSTLAVPTIISMLVTAIYNMADTYFVSQLGTSAAGAVGIVFSLMAIIQAVGFTLGMGSGSLISRMLGQKMSTEASRTASSAFFASLLFGLLLTVSGLLFLNPLMNLLGATPTILPYARDYARYILLGAPLMCASFVLNNILRAEGKAILSMFGIAAGGLLNIALDPLFIFVFDMGISGAAIATLISQCISFVLLAGCFIFNKTLMKLSLHYVSRKPSVYGKIIQVGFPSFCRQGLASIATVALNRSAAVYGDPAVAAMSIVGKIFMMILSIMIGFGQGFQPVVGFNYGAGRYDRVKEAVTFSLKAGFIIMTVLGAAGFLLAPELIALFRRSDPDVIAIGSYAFRAQCLVLPLFPLGVICNMTFQVLGKHSAATFLSAARQGIFFLPLILILPSLLHLRGIQLTQPLADLLTFFCCFPFLIPFLKELNRQIASQ